MSPAANVKLEALKDLRGALVRYRDDALQALADADAEIRRAFDWLQGRETAWLKAAAHWEQEMNRATAEGEWRKAKRHYEEALYELGVVRKWTESVADAARNFTREARQFANVLNDDLPAAAALLESKVRSLEAYVGIGVPWSSASARGPRPLSSAAAIVDSTPLPGEGLVPSESGGGVGGLNPRSTSGWTGSGSSEGGNASQPLRWGGNRDRFRVQADGFGASLQAVRPVLEWMTSATRKALTADAMPISANSIGTPVGMQVHVQQPGHGFGRVFSSHHFPFILIEIVPPSDPPPSERTHPSPSPVPVDWHPGDSKQSPFPDPAERNSVAERVDALVHDLPLQTMPTMALVIDPTTELVDLYGAAIGGWQLLVDNVSLANALATILAMDANADAARGGPEVAGGAADAAGLNRPEPRNQ